MMRDDSLCERCGECCRHGGPALHEEDLALFGEGVLGLEHCMTLRPGELVRDPLRDNVLTPLTHDVVKLRSSGADWTCMFYGVDDAELATCALYESRPLECRLQYCRSTGGPPAEYARGHLSREELLAEMPALQELVAIHEQACGYAMLAPLARRWRALGDQAAEQAVLEAIEHDRTLRSALVERLRSRPPEQVAGVVECVLGRPLEQTIVMFGMSLAPGEERRLERNGDWAYPL